MAAHTHNFGQFYVTVENFMIGAKIGSSMLDLRHGLISKRPTNASLIQCIGAEYTPTCSGMLRWCPMS
jgi:hypothetical protein